LRNNTLIKTINQSINIINELVSETSKNLWIISALNDLQEYHLILINDINYPISCHFWSVHLLMNSVTFISPTQKPKSLNGGLQNFWITAYSSFGNAWNLPCSLHRNAGFHWNTVQKGQTQPQLKLLMCIISSGRFTLPYFTS
jgi:hypothetical protein